MELEKLIEFITKIYTECDLHQPTICVQIGDQIAQCEEVGIAEGDDEDEPMFVFICRSKDRVYSCGEVFVDGGAWSPGNGA